MSIDHALHSAAVKHVANKSDSPNRKRLLNRQLLLWLIPCWFAVMIVMFVHYTVRVDNDKEYSLYNERVIVELIEKLLNESFNSMTTDAQMLAYTATQQNQTNKQQFTNTLRDYFVAFANNDSNYEQLRFIDTEGNERIRINNRNNSIKVVPEIKLQNKAQRYYFQRSLSQTRGNVYISPMDLNVEAGKIQLPLNPTIRVGIPVFDADDRKIGVIILNYKGRQLINRLLHISPNFIEHLYILSPDGVAIIQPQNGQLNQSKSLDFSFETTKQLSDDLVPLTSKEQQGQLLYKNNYITFSQVFTNHSGNWTVVSLFPKQRLNLARVHFEETYTAFYIVLLCTLSLLIASFQHHRNQTQERRDQQAYDKQFRLTLERIQFIAITINNEGIITFCNDFFLHLTGYEKHEVIGKRWVQHFIPEKLQQQTQEALQQAFQQGVNQDRTEAVVQSKANEIVLVSWSSTFTPSHRSGSASITFIGEDITEHKMEQAQLQRLSHAVEQSHNSVMITEITGEIIYVNPVFCEQTGYSKQEVLGTSPKFLQSGEMPEVGYQNLWQTLEAGKEWRGEFHNKKKNGELYWERARISPVKDSAGNALYFVAVKQDISKEKQLAEEIKQQEKLRIQQAKLAAVGNVVNMIAHDLRNPLSSIKMVLQIYARKAQDELFDISLEQVRYMEAILEDLLSYSRPEQFQPEWIDLNKLVELVINSQRRFAKDKDVALEFTSPPNLPTLYADPTKLRQALQNLIVNAIQAAESSEQSYPLVTISTNILLTEAHSDIVIDITNNGKSIDPCMTKKVFEPFYTTRAKGTGLGLAIVQRIVESHHGKITLKALTPVGTLAQVQLPLSHGIHNKTMPENDSKLLVKEV